jgi:ABC-type nitrate/sulfonate/bicarbonate transport system permease component
VTATTESTLDGLVKPAPVARPRSRRPFTRKQRIAFSVANLFVFMVIWELAARYSGVPKLFLPPLTSVFSEIGRMVDQGLLFDHLWFSFRSYAVGLAISLVIALPFGMLLGGVKVLDKIFSPYIWALYTLPRIILMPMILLYVGINERATLLLIVLSAAPATLVFVMDGVKTVDNSLLRAARSFGADRRRLFTHVAMPSTLPFIATGVRMGVARGLLGLFIGEIFTGVRGIGYVIVRAQKQFNSPRIFAMLLIFVLFSVLMVGVTQALERRASLWRVKEI